MRLQADRLVRVLLIAAPAVGLFWLLRGPSWAHGREALYVVAGGGALLGLVARALYASGRVRTAKGLGLSVIAGSIALAVYRIELGDWMSVTTAGGLGVAIYAVRSTRDTAGFAVGAALMAAASWYFWPVPALAALSFVVGRDSFGGAETTPRHALSQVGAGVLGMLMVTAIGFDLVALLVDVSRPDTMMSRAEVDGAVTYVPRLVVEGLLVAACLGHARGRSWSVLALAVLAPLLVVLLERAYPLPAMGGGCITWGHPLEEVSTQISIDAIGVFEIAVAVAVLPWAGPIMRAVRSPRS